VFYSGNTVPLPVAKFAPHLSKQYPNVLKGTRTWFYCIFHLLKRCEIRSWDPEGGYRAPAGSEYGIMEADERKLWMDFVRDGVRGSNVRKRRWLYAIGELWAEASLNSTDCVTNAAYGIFEEFFNRSLEKLTGIKQLFFIELQFVFPSFSNPFQT